MKRRGSLQANLDHLERTDPVVAAAKANLDRAVAEIIAKPLVALSLRQPWAWMVAHGGKTIENRRWNTKFRGPFLIHAAKGMTAREYDEAVDFAEAVDPWLHVPPRASLDFGGIIGSAEIVDVIPPHGLQGELCAHRWHMPEQYGFVLRNVKPLPFRALRGELGFFKVRGPRASKQ
jgi:hypothetical protein